MNAESFSGEFLLSKTEIKSLDSDIQFYLKKIL